MKQISEKYYKNIQRILQLRKFRAIDRYRQLIQKLDYQTNEENMNESKITSEEMASLIPQVYGNKASIHIQIVQKDIVNPIHPTVLD